MIFSTDTPLRWKMLSEAPNSTGMNGNDSGRRNADAQMILGRGRRRAGDQCGRGEKPRNRFTTRSHLGQKLLGIVFREIGRAVELAELDERARQDLEAARLEFAVG